MEPEDVRRRLVLHRADDAPRRPSRRSARQFGPPALDWVGPIPHPALQSMFDGLYPPGDQWYWKADFVKELPDEAIERHVEYGAQLPTWNSTMHLYPIDGAAGRVAKDATAWNYRDANWGMVIVGVSPDPADNARDDRLGARLLGGAAPLLGRRRLRQHDDGREGQDRVRASYGDHYDRLAADQGASTTRQPLPGQPEHQAGVGTRTPRPDDGLE